MADKKGLYRRNLVYEALMAFRTRPRAWFLAARVFLTLVVDREVVVVLNFRVLTNPANWRRSAFARPRKLLSKRIGSSAFVHRARSLR